MSSRTTRNKVGKIAGEAATESSVRESERPLKRRGTSQKRIQVEKCPSPLASPKQKTRKISGKRSNLPIQYQVNNITGRRMFLQSNDVEINEHTVGTKANKVKNSCIIGTDSDVNPDLQGHEEEEGFECEGI